MHASSQLRAGVRWIPDLSRVTCWTAPRGLTWQAHPACNLPSGLQQQVSFIPSSALNFGRCPTSAVLVCRDGMNTLLYGVVRGSGEQAAGAPS